MLMLHRSSSTDDVIVDRPNDDRGVRVESLMIYDKGCIVYYCFVYYEFSFFQIVIAELREQEVRVVNPA